ncbi:carboxypeptidase-like protein [Neolewinella xylanilytica]|uniref:Carboxypeptidase-like protein n=1 Tax=Neolewinella xylanilytica TaxID=1514080 RepID=A0A2S6I8A8_9BACT|nr:carboxypeptidase-like regulatory domain-containing protein [Neolewinella xylanilytica]PPK87721.1 carboxypeptidase-like protein [Neolewinella xylanilytica]
MRLLCFLALFSAALSGQVTITGYVVDAVSREPVPFANVVLEEDQSRGVLTNELGQFAISLDSATYRYATLAISSIAYEVGRVRLAEEAGLPERPLVIRLESQFVELPGVVVISDLGLRQLVRRALDRIPENYGHDAYHLKAYHRSYFATNVGFAQLNEGYLTIADGPYVHVPAHERERAKVWIDQLRVTKGSQEVPAGARRFFDRQSFLTGGYSWLGNPLYRDSLGYLFRGSSGEDLEHLTFQQIGQYFDGTDTLVRLRYTHQLKAPGRPPPGEYTGEAVINLTDYSFSEIRMGYVGNPTAVYTAYQKVNGKYYPQRSSFTWALDQDWREYPRIFTLFFFVTDVITDPEKMKRYQKGRRLRDGAAAMSALRIREDPAFWRGEERMLQLPAEDVLRFEIGELMKLEPPADSRDTLSADSARK